MVKHTFPILIVILSVLAAAGCGGGGGANPVSGGGLENLPASSQDGPAALRARVAGVGKVEIEWNPMNPSDEDDEETLRVEYLIYRRQSEEESFREISRVSTNYYLDHDLASGVTYHYQVSSFADGVEIRGSETASVTMSYDTDTGLVGALHGIGQIKLTWREVGPADLEGYDQTKMGRILGYDIYRSTEPEGDYEKISSEPVAIAEYVDKGLENGRTYYYKISVSTERGRPSFYSKTVPVATFDGPHNLKIPSYTYKRVHLRWDSVYNLDNLVGYNIYRRSDDEEYSLVAKVDKPEVSLYIDGPVPERQLYYYKVSAYSESQESKTSNEVSVKPFGFVYVTNYYGNTLSVIRAEDDHLTVALPLGDGPHGVALSPDGSRVYVANNRSNTLSIVDSYENRVVANVDLGDHPVGVAVHPDGSKIYISNYYANNIYVIEAGSNRLLRSIGVGSGPRGLALSPDGGRLYVANYYADTVSVVDTGSYSSLVSIPVGSGPTSLILSPDGESLYVANHFTDTILVISTRSYKSLAAISVKSGPLGMAVSPDGRWLYVVSYFEGAFSVVDLSRNKETATLKVGKYPQGVTLFPELAKAYVTNFHSDTVSVVDLKRNQLISTLDLKGGPLGIVLSP